MKYVSTDFPGESLRKAFVHLRSSEGNTLLLAVILLGVIMSAAYEANHMLSARVGDLGRTHGSLGKDLVVFSMGRLVSSRISLYNAAIHPANSMLQKCLLGSSAGCVARDPSCPADPDNPLQKLCVYGVSLYADTGFGSGIRVSGPGPATYGGVPTSSEVIFYDANGNICTTATDQCPYMAYTQFSAICNDPNDGWNNYASKCDFAREIRITYHVLKNPNLLSTSPEYGFQFPEVIGETPKDNLMIQPRWENSPSFDPNALNEWYSVVTNYQGMCYTDGQCAAGGGTCISGHNFYNGAACSKTFENP